MRTFVSRTLKPSRTANVTTVEANNHLEGLAMVAKHKPQAICCDWHMPAAEGFDLLCKLRDDGNEVLFGLATSERSAEVKKEAEDAGAAFFIAKPLTPDAFAAALTPVPRH
jgi:CheY-like chemotaxis protein